MPYPSGKKGAIMKNNYWLTCPDGHGSWAGYLSPELSLKETCIICSKDMQGFRVLERADKS